MTTLRVGVQAPAGGEGQLVDIDGASATISSITNASAEAVQYSINSGGSWATLAASSVVSGVGNVLSGAMRLRKVSSGAYPAPVDIEATFNGAGLTASEAAAVSSAVVVPAVGATASDVANRELLQAALTAGGNICFSGSGIAYIDTTLTIYGNTKLFVQAGLTVKISNPTSAGIPVLQNYAFTQRNAGATVTITWSSGTSASVAWTAHGLAVGECFRMQGATLSVYNLVAQVLTVTDADNVVIELNYVPSGAPSGTIKAVKCDQNITVDCPGAFDYSHSGAIVTSDLNSCGVHLCLIQNLNVPQINILNAEKFALHTAALRDAKFGHVNAPVTNSDVVKCYGPMQNVEFGMVSGNAGDDGFSFHPYEAPGFPNFQWTRGDMINCRLNGTDIRTRLSAGGIAVCYPNEVDKMIGIKFANIGGSVDTGSAVRIGAYNSATDTIDDLTVDGVTARCRYGVFLQRDASNTLTVKSLTVRGLASVPIDTSSIGMLVSAGTSIDSGEIQLAMNNALWTGGNYAIQVNGTYKRLQVSGTLTGGGTCRGVNLAAAQTGHLIVSLNQRTGDQLIGGSLVSGTITLMGCDTQTAGVIATSGVSGTVDVNLVGNKFNNASNGVVRGTTGTFNIRSSGNHFMGSSVPAVAPSGSPVFNLYGYDLAVDPIALSGIGTANGQFCTSTQAATEGGPCVKTAAGWVALGTGASGINTVIA